MAAAVSQLERKDKPAPTTMAAKTAAAAAAAAAVAGSEILQSGGVGDDDGGGEERDQPAPAVARVRVRVRSSIYLIVVEVERDGSTLLDQVCRPAMPAVCLLACREFARRVPSRVMVLILARTDGACRSCESHEVGFCSLVRVALLRLLL